MASKLVAESRDPIRIRSNNHHDFADKNLQQVINSITELALDSKSQTAEAGIPGKPDANGNGDCKLYQYPEGAAKSGTVGFKTKLITNYLSLTIKTETKKLELYEYFIKFEPELEGWETETQKRFLMNQFDSVIGCNWIFKSSWPQKLFLNFKLAKTKMILPGIHPRTPDSKYKLILELVDRTEINQITQFCDALFIRLFETLGLVELNQKLYDPYTLFQEPSKRLEIWPGILVYTRHYESGLMLGFDTTIRAMKTTNCYEVFEFLSQSPDVQAKFCKYTIGKSFMTRFNSVVYKIVDIDWSQSPMTEVTVGAKQMTYVDYYNFTYGIKVNNLDQPLLVAVANLRKHDKGEIQVLRRLIPELCIPMRLEETRAEKDTIKPYLAKCIRVPPMKKVDMLQAYAEKVKNNEDCQALLSSWNLEIGNFIRTDGRVLDPPKLDYVGKLQDVIATLGGDSPSAAYCPVSLKKWLVFCTDYDSKKIHILLNMFISEWEKMGSKITKPDIIKIEPVSRDSAVVDFNLAIRTEIGKREDVQLIMIIMPSTRHQTDFYSSMKRLCILELGGVPVQMIKSSTMNDRKKLAEMIEDLVVQVNCKIGGSPRALHFSTEESIMFVGIDTYHSHRKSPSVFAIIISLNTSCTKYYSRASLQAPHQETGDNIFAIFSRALAHYHDENGKWPDRIIVFRDGINNKSMELVKEYELGQMRRATAFLAPHHPKFLFIIVQKRIIERLYMTQDDLSSGNGIGIGNPKVGTVLDDTLTRLQYFDFFLVSKTSEKGTVTPVHYVVIANDDDCSPDLIQEFAHASCFMYFNSPSSIRVPGICQYAHRLASLVGTHLTREPDDDKIHRQLYFL